MSFTANTKEQSYQKLAELVERFRNHKTNYKTSSYNETLVRRDFIDPFFECFNWDVDNKSGKDMKMRDVFHEDKVKVNENKQKKTKSPDYSFRVDGKRLFFVEAKKPAVDIKESIDPAYQLRRYGASAKLPISILTDFEEFSIYDSYKMPKPTDKASVSRLEYINFENYLEKFDFLWNLLEYSNVANGSIIQYIGEDKTKKGSENVDDALLATLDDFRVELASNISKLNISMTERDINLVVQNTIDRIIFLRIAEDRGIEDYETLLNAVSEKSEGKYYTNLLNIFYKADERYNSGLFDFEKDAHSKSVIIDDKILKGIIKNLYFPHSPFEFSVIPIEILGSAYEQFLGKTITLNDKHKASIEYKPEVRKAGGVYYTPEYIVNYIVENTVGTLIKGKSPNQIKSIKIVDPSCGSGSFLIGAYNYLLEYHTQYYIKNPPKTNNKKENPIHEDGRLTVNTKKSILINNIFGVDIDMQAVEVTKLSLMLRCLEGENNSTLANEMSLFNERVLPSMENNIRCGNSLIGSDFYDRQMEFDFTDTKTMYKINAFDWQDNFKSVFAQGGFDCVIGNPPYVKIQTMTEDNPIMVEALKNTYFSASAKNIDLYVCFVEKALNLLNENGISGYILPHKFFEADMGENLRSIISKKKALNKVVYFGANQVFKNATTYTCLLFLTKKENDTFKLLRVYEECDLKEVLDNNKFEILPSKIVGADKWNFHNESILSILDKLKLIPVKLENVTRKIFIGLQTSADDIYVIHNGKENNGMVTGYSESLDREVKIESGILKPFLIGKDIKRYEELSPCRWILFPYILENGQALLYTQKEIKDEYPLAWEYFLENKKVLESREKGKFKNTWWQYGRNQNLTEFEVDKISFPDIGMHCNAVIDKNNIYHKNSVYSLAFDENLKYCLNFYLALLNSKLFTYYVRLKGTVIRGGYTRFNPRFMNDFPVPDPTKDQELELSKLVENMIALKSQQSKIGNSRDIEIIERQIAVTDRKIDGIVYALYGLTEEEIKTIEGE